MFNLFKKKKRYTKAKIVNGRRYVYDQQTNDWVLWSIVVDECSMSDASEIEQMFDSVTHTHEPTNPSPSPAPSSNDYAPTSFDTGYSDGYSGGSSYSSSSSDSSGSFSGGCE
ncbi:hypothetical protein J7384_17330 [Endozoicomonas sp. G2_1]|uniref:hypothetical protein n=1 Tax=Endozoicomonas sp. G2_1 TaxID=2821091 RepID=UPI001AD993E5|nr:hypothetical protein [Endozoicomonas sp. G2_1]MBO9492128.1 hypothetical protein [Endozoicomonas sp. G2_1]